MGKYRKSWYEREFEKQGRISKDWVDLHCKLTEREVELLKIIYDRKMVRRDMLEIISPSYRHTGENRTLILNKSIRKMFTMGCIDKVHEKKGLETGNKPAILSLDRAGSLLLNVSHKKRIKHVRNIINNEEYITRELPANYAHIEGVNKLEVDTIKFCESNNFNLLNWNHEKPFNIHFGKEYITIIPDIIMYVQLENTLFTSFIEFDTGSEGLREKEPRIIREKIIKYKKLKLSDVWREKFDEFPMLLFITKDEKRTKFFNKKCKENGLRGFAIYYENYVLFLERLKKLK